MPKYAISSFNDIYVTKSQRVKAAGVKCFHALYPLYIKIDFIEADFINLIKASVGAKAAEFIGDDAAVVNPTKNKLVLSLDSLIEQSHFTTDIYSAYDIGWKSATANISDICAMGGKPLYMLVGLALPQNVQQKWPKEFYQGLTDCSNKHGGALVIGGDICKSKSIMVSIAIIGEANPQGVFMRSAAKPGYKLCVTGKFGNAKTFLDSYFSNKQLGENFMANDFLGSKLEDRILFLRPEPRFQESQKIWDQVKDGALVDSSDGLAAAMFEIAEQSSVKIIYDNHKIPRDLHISLDNALFGGEEYELVGCFAQVPEGFFEIGRVEAGDGVCESSTGEILTKDKIYRHFQN